MRDLSEVEAAQADTRWMQLALQLAAKGEGLVEPNPMVGCVLADGDQLLGEGQHRRFGGAHAEVVAIQDADKRGNRERLSGATAFVTLEPCCHTGKTPPCTQALVDVNVARVVIATLDPYPQVGGKGVEELERKGVQVDIGVCATNARRLNAPYFKRVELGVPWVIAKWAASLDGKIATRTGHSQWISCEQSRIMVHQLRRRVDAIMVGANTALADNPALTARLGSTGADDPNRRPIRIVVDSRLRMPADSTLATTAHDQPVLVACGPDVDLKQAARLEAMGVEIFRSEMPDANTRLKLLLEELAGKRMVTNLLVEGGAQLLGSLRDLDAVDQCEVFIAPKLLGGQGAPSALAGLGAERVDASTQWKCVVSRTCGSDTYIQCRRNND